MRDDAELVVAARSGQSDAFGHLVEQWFDRCWEVAWRILHDRDLAADVAQDTLLTAWQQLDRLQRPASFGGWVLRIARNRALDRLARERRAVPTADYDTLEPSVSGNDPTGPEAAFARAAERDLVWAAAVALGERDASLLDLHLRHGLEPHELAEELDIAPNAAHQALFRLRKRLGAAIRAWLLWRGNEPACVVLRAELAAAGDMAFGAATVRTIDRHVRTCEACAEERERVAAPAMLFSAVPLVAPPMVLRARAMRSLADAGVPVGDGAGSGSAGEGSAGDGSGSGEGSAGDGAGSGSAGEGAGSGSAGGAAVTTLSVVAGQDADDGSPQPTSSALRWLAGGVAGVLMLLAFGVLMWWRGTTEAVTPEVAGDTVAVPSPSVLPGMSDAPSTDPSGGQLGVPAASVADPPPTSQPTSDSLPPAARPPVISGFRASSVGRCPTARMGQFQLVWASQHGATATLTGADGTAEPVAVSGTVQRCAPDGAVFTLDVAGPGGTAQRTVEVVEGDEPERPGTPDELEGPGTPDEPEGPGTAAEPDGDTPDEPDTPEEPGEPEEPEAPGRGFVAPT